jgi:hypothetical protein
MKKKKKKSNLGYLSNPKVLVVALVLVAFVVAIANAPSPDVMMQLLIGLANAILKTFDLFVGILLSEIILGIQFWKISLGVIVVLSTFVTILGLIKKQQETSRKLEAQLALKKREEEEKQEVQKAIESFEVNTATEWETILMVVSYFRNDSRKYPDSLIKKMLTTPLVSIINISSIKKQIVWDGRLTSAFIILEILARKSYLDQDLRLLAKQIIDLKEGIKPYEKYDGYSTLIQRIDFYCPTIMTVIKDL